MFKNKSNINDKWNIIIKSVIIFIISTTVFIGIFAALMYFLELDKNYSMIFATLSVAFGCFITSFFASGKIGSKGYITGLIIGFSIFIIITLISMIIDKGKITSNTLFHFLIFILSSLIGGVMGVNKKPKKYI